MRVKRKEFNLVLLKKLENNNPDNNPHEFESNLQPSYPQQDTAPKTIITFLNKHSNSIIAHIYAIIELICAIIYDCYYPFPLTRTLK